MTQSRLTQILAASIALYAWMVPFKAQAQACDPDQAVARIVSVQGQVEVNQSPAKSETLICPGDIVSVSRLGRAAVKLFETDTTLRIDQETRFRVLEAPQERESLLDLLKGIMFIFSREPRSLKVYTPFVNATIEGTEFVVRSDEDRGSITVIEGTVVASNDKGRVEVNANQAAVALRGQAPQLIEVIKPEDAVNWALHYQPVLEALYNPKAAPSELRSVLGTLDYRNIDSVLTRIEGIPQGSRDAFYYVYRAAWYMAVGRSEAAREDLTKATQMDPANSDASALLSLLALTQNNQLLALELARHAVEQNSDSAAAYIALSYALQSQFDLDGAKVAITVAVQHNPDNVLALARLSELQLSKGEVDEAVATARRAAKVSPNVARTQTVLGFANLSRIDIASAKQAFTTAIELDQTAPLPRLGLGLAKIRSGELEAGRGDIETAVSLDPLNSLLRSYLGKAFYEENKNQLAGSQFELAKQMDPADPTPWLYDAIRKQSENRPIGAVRDLQKSVELNDNRAVYRSELLLDEDLATRGINLARSYNELGFDQVAIILGSESVSLDPANDSAHGLLSDSYATKPRHEIARASELLQAQLLQPGNGNPLQPQLAESDLNIHPAAGPANVGFNEYTPMFTSEGTNFYLSGMSGSNNTWGDELVLSGLKGPVSYSIGQFHYEGDGFRENNDLQHDIYNGFVQVAFTDKFDIQFEYRHRESEQGDLRLNFDLTDFSPDNRRIKEEDVYRAGAHYAASPQSDFVFSLIYNDRTENNRFAFPGAQGSVVGQEDGYQAELQYLHRFEQFNVIAGFGDFETDTNLLSTFSFPGGVSVQPPVSYATSHENFYLYSNVELSPDFITTIGFSHDSYKSGAIDLEEFNPKLGMRWRVSENISVRAAAFQTVKRSLITNQTIEPTQIAGFNQFFDYSNGVKATQYGLGLDAQLSDSLFWGIELLERDLETPLTSFQTGKIEIQNSAERLYSSYLYWSPHINWAVSGQINHEAFESDPSADPNLPVEVNTTSVPLFVRYFNPSGFFAEFGTTYVRQDVERLPESTKAQGDDDFYLVDIALGFRLPKRSGVFTVGVNNLLDEEFSYQDYTGRVAEPVNSGFRPERTLVARFTLNF